MDKDVECPYCGAEQEINHDDGYGYEENVMHRQDCRECEKTFTYTTSILYYYESKKADCLNGESHKYKQTQTCPRISTKMRCQICGKERTPTNEEWHDILSKEDIINAKKKWTNVKWIQNL